MKHHKRLMMLGIILLCLAGIFSYVGATKMQVVQPVSSPQTVQQKNTFKIAIVNEDNGMIYNGEPVKIGETLLQSFALANVYEIELVSRAIAERGLAQENYQLMIILPSKFSEDALNLESAQPTKALFHYQILSDKPLVVKQAEQAVADLKALFNKDLIKIYFSSIVGNLQTAQTRVSESVQNEQTALRAYRSELVNPLISYSQQFDGLKHSPKILVDTYSLFNKDLHHTNEAFTSIIDTDRVYDKELETIKQQQDTWQGMIEAREKSLLDYDTAFSQLTVAEQLQQLQIIQEHLSTELANPVSWQEAQENTESFNHMLTILVERLNGLNERINQTLAQYDNKIEQAVEDSLVSWEGMIKEDGTVEQTLGLYLQSLDRQMTQKLNERLVRSMYYDEATIDKMALSDADKHYLKNISTFIDWYTTQNEGLLPQKVMTSYQEEHFQAVKQHVLDDLKQTKHVRFSVMESEEVEELRISLPVDYELNVLGNTLTRLEDGLYTVSIPQSKGGEIVIDYQLSPKGEDISVLQPVSVVLELMVKETVEVVDKPSITNGLDKDANEVANPLVPVGAHQKEMKRTYTQATTHFPYASYNGENQSTQVFKDVSNYLALAGMIETFYDLDLMHQDLKSQGVTPGKQAIVGQHNQASLKAITTKLLKDATINTLKQDLTFPKELLASLAEKQLQASALSQSITALKEDKARLGDELLHTLNTAREVQLSLQNKPVFLEHENRDNTNLVSVSLEINQDLVRLLGASRKLVDNTKSHQSVADTIQQQVDQLSTEVNHLEQEGSALSSRVDTLYQVMSEEYASNEQFLQAFSDVLKHTKMGTSKNMAIFEYLSNPVDASKINAVLGTKVQEASPVRRDERTAFLVIMLAYLMSLALAYLVEESVKKKGLAELSQRISWKNAQTPMTLLSGIGVILGILIAVMTGMKLAFSFEQHLVFSCVLVVVVLGLTYGLNMLLRNLKGLGFLMSVMLVMLYMTSATQLLDTHYSPPNQVFTFISPLTHIEKMLSAYLNQGNLGLSFGLIVLLTSILSLFVSFNHRHIKE